MGLDTQFMAKLFVDITNKDLESLKRKFYKEFDDERHPDCQGTEREDGYPELRRRYEYDSEYNKLIDPEYLEVVCLHRYYGIGYERGNWPYIQKMGDWLAIHLGELAELRYGNDCNPYWEEMEQWARIRIILVKHWEEVENEPYR